MSLDIECFFKILVRIAITAEFTPRVRVEQHQNFTRLVRGIALKDSVDQFLKTEGEKDVDFRLLVPLTPNCALKPRR
jgi:hypothetical protein